LKTSNDAVFSIFFTKFHPLNYFFKRRIHIIFRRSNLEVREHSSFFQLVTKLYFKSNLELRNLEITKSALLVIPIKQLRFLNIPNIYKKGILECSLTRYEDRRLKNKLWAKCFRNRENGVNLKSLGKSNF